MVECAEREMLEETGLRLRNVSATGPPSQAAFTPPSFCVCQ